ncbi:alpha/beta fold hydrolase [Streptomyces sp. NPDC048337]|uniref:alpha/beta fold hydrolase n=1 Tax=Streptomyces sp. NPDC048337 TaxID=3365535 RepID=UPI003712FF5C
MPPAAARAAAMRSFRTAYDQVLEQRWPDPYEPVDLPTPCGITRVNSCGPADAPPLVLLPGGGATSTVWGACVAAGLARSHRVHAVDLVGDPGPGVPAPGRPVRAVADLIGWLDAVLDVPGVSHHARPLTAAAEIARCLAVAD